MPRTKLEIESESLDELSNRLLAAAAASDKVAASASGATNAIASGAEKASRAVDGNTEAIRSNVREIIKQGDAGKSVSRLVNEEAKARRNAYIEQQKASGRLTAEQAEQAKQLGTVLSLFKQLERAATSVDGLKIPTDSSGAQLLANSFSELSKNEQSAFIELVKLTKQFDELKEESKVIDEIVAELDAASKATDVTAQQAVEYALAMEKASARQAEVTAELKNTERAAASLEETLRPFLEGKAPADVAVPQLTGGDIDREVFTGNDSAEALKNTADATREVEAAMINLGEQARLATEAGTDGFVSLTDQQLASVASIQQLVSKYQELEEEAAIISEIKSELESASQAQGVTAEEASKYTEAIAELAVRQAEVTAEMESTQVAAAQLGQDLGDVFKQVETPDIAGEIDQQITTILSSAEALRSVEDAQAAVEQATASATSAAVDQEESAKRIAAQERNRKSLIEQTTATIKRLKAEQLGAKDEQTLAKVNKELDKAQENYQRLSTLGLFENEAESAKSLRTRVFEARAEVVRLVESTGGITPEVVAAASEAAELRDQIGDINALIGALNPEERFQAFVGAGSAITGGFQAAVGTMSLLGLETKDTEEVTKDLLALMNIAQGLNAFGGIVDAMKNLKALFLVLTTARQADTAATVTATTATTANAAATTASAGATGVLTGAIKGVTAAMAANPILTAVVVLTAITAAIVALGEDSEDSAEKAQKLVGELKEIESLNTSAANRIKNKQLLENELLLIARGGTEEAKRNKIVLDGQAERRALQLQYQTALETELTLQDRIARLQGSTNEEEVKALKEYEQQLVDTQEQVKGLKQDVKNSFTQQTLDLLKFDVEAEDERTKKLQEEADKRKQIAAENAAFEKQLRADLDKAVLGLGNRAKDEAFDSKAASLEAAASQAAQAGQIEEEARFREQLIELRRGKQQEEIDLMEQDLKRKVAIIELNERIGREAIQNMSEETLNAKLDALIAEQNISLEEEQLSQIGLIRANVNAAAQRQLTQVVVDESTKRIAVAEQEGRAQLDLIGLREDYANARIDAVGDNQEELLKVLAESGITEVDQVRSVEEAKLLVVLDAAKKRLAILEESGKLEDAVQAERLKKVIADTQQQLEDLPKFNLDIGRLLGIDEQAMKSLQPLVENALASITDFVRNNLFTDKIAAIDTYISKLDESIAATQANIETERKAKEDGDTNNLAAEQDKMRQLQQMKDDAVKEQERLAQKQRIADAAAIISGTVLTVVNVLKDSALKGGVLGIAIAAAVIPGIFALINAAKGKARAVGQGFQHGTPYVDHLGKHKTGIDTVPANLTRGERVVTVEKNKRDWTLQEGLRTDDRNKLIEGMAETARREGITLDELLAEFGSKSPILYPSRPAQLPTELAVNRERLESLRRSEAMSETFIRAMLDTASNTKELVRLEKDAVDRHFLPDGTRIEIDRRGNTKTTKRTTP